MKTSIRWAIGQRRLLQELGIDIERCFREAGITRDQWADPGSYIDEELLHRFYESCLAAYGNPFLGILMAEHFSLDYTGFLGLALISAPTHGDAIELALEFPNISGLEFPFSQKVSKDELGLLLTPDTNVRDGMFDFFCNYNIAGFYKAAREIADGPVSVSKVRFMHEDEKNRRRYERHFGCDIEFGAVQNELAFPIDYLTAVPPRSDPEIFSIMYERCRSLNKRITDEEKFEDKVERVVLATDSGGWCVEAVASQLHVSTRTLKRRLESEGTNFSLLVNRVRESLAKEYLTHTQWKVDVIASELGYSSGSNFGQAFKQWVGLTPSEYREQSSARGAHGHHG